MKSISLALCAFAFLAHQLPGQDPAFLAEVKKDLDFVFEREPGPVNRQQAQERFKDFWKKYEGKKLGAMSYARGLSLYWHRDMEAALESLDEYLSNHEPKLITNSEQRNTIGRLYLNAVVQEGRKDAAEVDGERIVQLASRFVRCYDNTASVIHHATRHLVGDKAKYAAAVRVAMCREILAKGLPPAETDENLEVIYGAAAPARRTARKPAPRRKMPTTIKPFSETTMSGKVIDLFSYRGQVVLVDFWATWCGPCIRELPNVVKAHEKYKGRGFTVIGISLDKPDAEAKIQGVAKKMGMTWEQIYDGGYFGAKLAKENGIPSIPAAFLIDRNGKVRFSGGEARGKNLDPNIQKLLDEKPQPGIR